MSIIKIDPIKILQYKKIANPTAMQLVAKKKQWPFQGEGGLMIGTKCTLDSVRWKEKAGYIFPQIII